MSDGSVNEVILVGRIGQDPKFGSAKSGMLIANLNLATTSKIKGEEVTQWHKLVAFPPVSETIEKYVTKGSRLYIRGPIEYREWEDKKGNKREVTEIKIKDMRMLDNKEHKEEKKEVVEKSLNEMLDNKKSNAPI